MSYFISKILISLCCVLLTLTNSDLGKNTYNISIIALLISVILCGLASIFLEHNKDVSYSNPKKCIIDSLFAIYILITFWNPLFLYFIPIIAMEMYTYRFIVSSAMAIISILIFSFSSPIFSIFSLLFSGVSIVLAFCFDKQTALTKQIHEYQDLAKEKEFSDREKQKHLIEAQDANIYYATLSERNRIARDIHDNVGHLITSSILQVGSLKVINKNEVLKEPLNVLHDTLNTAMTSMRSSVHDLYDDSVDMKSAIIKIVEDINQVSEMEPEKNIKCVLNYDCGNVIPKNIKYAFIAIIKEATNNTLKHSNADRIDITVTEHPGFYKLGINDNGTNNISNGDRNETPTVSGTNGIGINNIYERVNGIGGNVQINSSNGFHINVTVMKQD